MVNFTKYRWLYFFISALVIGIGLFSLIKWGYRYSIEFVGGTQLEYQLSREASIQEIRKIFIENGAEIVEILLEGKNLSVRTKAINEKKELGIRTALEKNLSIRIDILRIETVGPTLGKEMVRKTLVAALLATLGILIYMIYAFKGINYAAAAIIANLHDLIVVVGSYSLLSHFFKAEVDTMFVTAVLTTMSFSLHDTIVIFDKIREYRHSGSNEKIEYYANKALTETMVRSINNSMTILFMLLSLTLLGGSTIRFFIITLLIGTITGTYSSPFVATPILVWLEKRKIKG